jgi:hypothetical protein
MTDDSTRAALERGPRDGNEGRDPFAVNTDLALGALRFVWGNAYDITYSSGWWLAARQDGLGGGLLAETPDEIIQLMREDYALKPVDPQ